MKQAFLIAAPMSGSGKTTIARGVMACLRQRGYTVQPFKCGPDYIDTKFHSAVCGRPSVNLDSFMSTPAHIRDLFARYGSDADVCVVEGMMGLFDGYDRDLGSSGEIAGILDIPVLLVVDARSAAYSTAALLRGFLGFREEMRIAGVIFNKVGSKGHEAMLREVCADLGVTCLGCVPKRRELEVGSRYLGLDFSEEGDTKALTGLIESHVDLEGLLSLSAPTAQTARGTERRGRTDGGGGSLSVLRGRRVSIARNGESFSFIYQEVLDSWRDVSCFDPERDVPDLSKTDLLYLPGGYPEKHLEALARNEACRRAIKAYAEGGGAVRAECGGMMYLCRSIITDEGSWPMCGVLPYDITARQADRRLSLGYRRFALDGREYRGHEFHYTRFSGPAPQSVTQVYDAKGRPVETAVLRYKNVLASYCHLTLKIED